MLVSLILFEFEENMCKGFGPQFQIPKAIKHVKESPKHMISDAGKFPEVQRFQPNSCSSETFHYVYLGLIGETQSLQQA